jgi:hypothetical protein
MRNLFYTLPLLALALIACSSPSATAAMPTPVRQRCGARISDGTHNATLAILFATAASAPVAAHAAAPAGAITLTPSSITLDAQHPSTRVAVADSAGYTGHYAITFIDCAGYLDVRWPNRSTLIITL